MRGDFSGSPTGSSIRHIDTYRMYRTAPNPQDTKGVPHSLARTSPPTIKKSLVNGDASGCQASVNARSTSVTVSPSGVDTTGIIARARAIQR